MSRHTTGGKPATAVQLCVFADVLSMPVPIQAPGPHFCRRCTMPCDGTPCPVCIQVRAAQVIELRAEADYVIANEQRRLAEVATARMLRRLASK